MLFAMGGMLLTGGSAVEICEEQFEPTRDGVDVPRLSQES